MFVDQLEYSLIVYNFSVQHTSSVLVQLPPFKKKKALSFSMAFLFMTRSFFLIFPRVFSACWVSNDYGSETF